LAIIVKMRLSLGEIARKAIPCRVWLLNLRIASILNRNAVAPYSPGLPLRLP